MYFHSTGNTKMEAVVVAVRPCMDQNLSALSDFSGKSYEVLLCDILLQNDSERRVRQFPKAVLSFEEEPAEVLCSVLYELTGGEKGGIKGEFYNCMSMGENSLDFAWNIEYFQTKALTLHKNLNSNPGQK